MLKRSQVESLRKRIFWPPAGSRLRLGAQKIFLLSNSTWQRFMDHYLHFIQVTNPFIIIIVTHYFLSYTLFDGEYDWKDKTQYT